MGVLFALMIGAEKARPLQIFVSSIGDSIEYPVVKGKKACSKFTVWT